MKIYMLTINALDYESCPAVEGMFLSRENAVREGERIRERMRSRLFRHNELCMMISNENLDSLLKLEFPEIAHIDLFHFGRYSDGSYKIEEFDIADAEDAP